MSIGISQLSESDLDFSYNTGQESDLSFLATTYAGLQMNADLYEGGQFVYQVIAEGANEHSDAFELRTEWLYLKQDLGAGYNMQVGRIRFPAFMDSENYYVGTTYPWVTPPTEIYEVLPITNIDGISFNHSILLGDWMLDTKFLLWGESSQGSEEYRLVLNDVSGLSFNLASDNLSLRLAYMVAEEEIQIDFPQDPNSPILEDLVANFGDDLAYTIASVKYDNSQLYASIEAVSIDADKGVLDENRNWNITTGWYFGPVLAYIGYSETKVTNEDTMAEAITDSLSGAQISYLYQHPVYGPVPTDIDIGNVLQPYLNKQQHTSTIGIKYNFNPKASLKVQVQYLDDFDGTFGNFSSGPLPFDDIYIYDIAIQAFF